MKKLLLLCLLIFCGSSVLAGTAFCTFEHTSRYSSDLITDGITGYMCKLDLDIKGDRVNDVGGGHEGGESDSKVDIIKVLPEYYSYLTSFPGTFCSRFSKLEIIDMCGTEIATIEANSLNKCKDLRILQFYKNKIEKIPEKLLAENKKLLKLFINYNLIKTLPENLLSGLKELKLLDLSYNHIDVLPDKIFHGLKDLEDLNLEGNELQNIEPVLFEHLEKLEKLNLNSNGISDLPTALFSDLANLKDLSLRDNKLTIIDADSFPQNIQIDTVVLTKNQINAIDQYFIETCGVSNLKMGGNVCDNTSSIKKKDMKKKLKKCFDNYITMIVETIPIEPTTTSTEPTSTTTRRTTTTSTEPTSTTTRRTTTTSTEPTSTTTRRTTTTTPKPTTTTTRPSTTTPKPITIKKTTTTTESTTTEFYTSTTNPIKIIDALYQPCGVSKVGVPNVVNGQVIVHGTHPWIAAIIYDSNYLCGGSLVTTKKVVSAAHCFDGKDLIKKEASKALVILGAQQLNNTNEIGRVVVGVKKILVHSTWNPLVERYNGDIAVLILEEEVIFSSYIQPVCLTKYGVQMQDLNDGVIVGFGKSESSISHENEPRKAFTPIQKTSDCFSKFPILAGISAHRTFCGGNANGTGSCTGDSGGGLTVVNGGRHFLRGIVSASLYASKYGCDVNSYAIFTDMRFYTTFVRDAK